MNLLNILLQAAGEQPQGAFGGWSGIVMMVALFAIFYFFMIRPQSKRQKELRKFQDSLVAGKQVVTSGGIFGKVREVKDGIVVLEIADNVRIKVSKGHVFDAEEPAAKAETK